MRKVFKAIGKVFTGILFVGAITILFLLLPNWVRISIFILAVIVLVACYYMED